MSSMARSTGLLAWVGPWTDPSPRLAVSPFAATYTHYLYLAPKLFGVHDQHVVGAQVEAGSLKATVEEAVVDPSGRFLLVTTSLTLLMTSSSYAAPGHLGCAHPE
jgi:hypothetical protein